jgi:hypothetical protein
MKKAITSLFAFSLLFGVPSLVRAQGAGGVTGSEFWVNGVTYRSVNTPTNLPEDAPDSTFDNIYIISQGRGSCVPGPALELADKAPGDVGFNGGRWSVYFVVFGPDPTHRCANLQAALEQCSRNGSDFRYASDLQCVFDKGLAFAVPIRRFECPVIRDLDPIAR